MILSTTVEIALSSKDRDRNFIIDLLYIRTSIVTDSKPDNQAIGQSTS